MNCCKDKISLFTVVTCLSSFFAFSSKGAAVPAFFSLCCLVGFVIIASFISCQIYSMHSDLISLMSGSNVILHLNKALAEISLPNRSRAACRFLRAAYNTLVMFGLLVLEWSTVHPRSISCVIPLTVTSCKLEKANAFPNHMHWGSWYLSCFLQCNITHISLTVGGLRLQADLISSTKEEGQETQKAGKWNQRSMESRDSGVCHHKT